MNILLVEDSPSDARFLIKILTSWGQEKWDIHPVVRLGDALEICQDYRFNIALLDLGLPDSDGWETVATFHREQPDIPIVVLTGFDNENMALQVIAQGAQDYLVKGSISAEVLIRSIRYSLERGQIFKQLRENQRALQEKNAQLQAVLDAVPGLVAWINQDLCYSGVNENFANILQLSPQQVAHQPIDFAPPCSRLADFLKGFMVGEQLRENQVLDWEIDSRIFHYLMVAQKYYNNRAALVVGIDITEREEAEKILQKNWEKEKELNHMKTNFLSMVSHDFRGPLTNILMCTDFLKNMSEGTNNHPQNVFFLQAIEKAVKQMVSLLDEVLLITRSESGKLDYEPALVNLEDFCHDLFDFFNLNEDERYELDFQIIGSSFDVEMDQKLLHHILSNLLSNAIKYSPMGGKIQFSCISNDHQVIFEIKDSGIGIPQKEQEKLFDTFYRASNVGMIKGTGLGLSIVKHCVALHQGEIEYESEEGVGTTFRVKLPKKVLTSTLDKSYVL